MVIENDLAILEGMVGLLESWGFEAIPTMSAEEALEALQSLAGPPNLIIADYHLDGGTGLAAAADINAYLAKPVATIIITADRSLKFDLDASQGGLSVLWKPLKTEALFREIEGKLEKSASVPPSPLPLKQTAS